MTKNAIFAAMRESVVQQSQRYFCKAAGLLYYHIRRTDLGQGDGGFPDSVIPAGRVLWLIENKTEDGRLSPKQVAWSKALANVTSVKYRVVRPSNWETVRDEILRDMEAA